MKIGIVCPVYISSDILFDFTKQTIESIQSKEHDLNIYLINNFSLPEYYPSKSNFSLHESVKGYEVIEGLKDNSVGKAWNMGIKKSLADGCEYVMVINNDIVLHHKCVDNLITFADMHSEFVLWTASEWIDIRTLNGIKEADINWSFDDHPHFSYFMVNQKTIDTVGWFDENIKLGYMEDGDYHYRILLSGNKAGKTAAAKFYHYGSRTIKVDDELYNKNKRTYEDNRLYIGIKWGIDFHDKVFAPPESILEQGYKHPFNDPKRDLKNW